jgi:hypothetical protein
MGVFESSGSLSFLESSRWLNPTANRPIIKIIAYLCLFIIDKISIDSISSTCCGLFCGTLC